MQILVLSDCHHSVRAAEQVIALYENINKVFFLGDGAEAVGRLSEFFPKKQFFIVSGNCDTFSTYSDLGQAVIEGKKIIFTHGHKYHVKYGLETLQEIANNLNADLVLYGHTHVQKCEYINGRYFVNPGALSQPRDTRSGYAVIDVTDKGIVVSMKNI